MKRTFNKLNYFYIEDLFSKQLLNHCIELISYSMLKYYKLKKNNTLKENYKKYIQQNLKKLIQWCINNNISNYMICEEFLQIITSTSSLNCLANENKKLIDFFDSLKTKKDIAISQFKIPSYKEVKKLKIENIPNSAFITNCLFELNI
ncbi:hypothetical protein BCR36DRAFT_461760 [Piromyces finnis]|uniref:Uncharacterized protein n=1 Tax=Piromyces finnis TaxID=1754191 RepID=A0A1Y1UX56_9FUNG|nr:hypothetical protein BCR36DRAFT_461760 [Piromyces finnis]|eukprot:ORX42805.1 hypothetical protein BCR36DRAFT_461760 [Piromyces finnis]